MNRLSILACSLFCALGACATAENAPFPHLLAGGDGGMVDTAGSAALAGAGSGSGGTSTGSAGTPTQTAGGPSAGSGTGGGDACPDDPLKTAPGACGCGKAETDTDGDGTPDCTDECPMVKEKTKAGCGCTATGSDEAACQALIAGLAHRYTFGGTGTNIEDLKGTADAKAVNLTLGDTGSLDFTTGDQYGDLPNGVLSALTNVTIEAWVTWQGGPSWQRIIDLGDSASMVEDERSSGRSYVFLAPRGDGNFVRGVYRKAGSPEIIIDSTPSLIAGDPSQVTLVLDDDHDSMTLYVNGAAVGTKAFPDHLSDVHDINNWLGRSQFATDPSFVGNMQEVRIYQVALSAAQVAYSFSKGSDAPIFGN